MISTYSSRHKVNKSPTPLDFVRLGKGKLEILQLYHYKNAGTFE